MAFYSLSEAEQHIMDYMWAHADQEEIHLNEIMEYMETKGYVWKQQTAYSFVIRLKNKKILSSTKRGKRRYYSVPCYSVFSLLSSCFCLSSSFSCCSFTNCCNSCLCSSLRP